MKNGQNSKDFETILQTTDPDLLWTWSYVLTALEIPHQTFAKDNVFHLLVPEELKISAIKEISDYFSEQNQKSRDQQLEEQTMGQTPAFLLVSSITLFYLVTGSWNENSIWFQLGAGDSQKILEHFEWHRLITSLTLHADVIHLLNNCILGGFLLHFFFLLVGAGTGLLALLLTAAAGNFINVALHGPGHIFVGFSTAIFAVVGMLSMLRYSDNSHSIGSHAFVPMMAGAALLAMLGSAGERTDLGSHLFGLFCGLLMGKLLSLPKVKRLRDSIFVQIILFFSTLIAVLLSWILSFRAC